MNRRIDEQQLLNGRSRFGDMFNNNEKKKLSKACSFIQNGMMEAKTGASGRGELKEKSYFF